MQQLDFSSVGAIPANPPQQKDAPKSPKLDFSSVGAIPAQQQSSPKDETTTPPPTELMANSNNEGLYTMYGRTGKGDEVGIVKVPFSKVPDAQKSGYTWYGNNDGKTDAERYQKDKKFEGKGPALGGKITDALQPVPFENRNDPRNPNYHRTILSNTDRAALRQLVAIPGYVKDLAVAAENMHETGDPKEFFDLINPYVLPKSMYEQFRDDWSSGDHKLAVDNLMGTMAGLGITALATHGAAKGVRSLANEGSERVRTAAQSMMGAGERQVKASVEKAARDAQDAARIAEQHNRAVLAKHQHDVDEANRKNTQAHVQHLVAKAETEKANVLAAKAVEEHNRAVEKAHKQAVNDADRENTLAHVKWLEKRAETLKKNAEAAKAVEEHNRAELAKHQKAVDEANRAHVNAHVQYLADKAEIEHSNEAARAIPDSHSGLEHYIKDKSEDLDVRVEKARHDALAEGSKKYSAVNEELNPVQADMEAVHNGYQEAMGKISGSETEPPVLKNIGKRIEEGDAFTYHDLQGFYSELGTEISKGNLPGDIYHAYDTMHEAIGSDMQRIADSKGMGLQLKDARAYWRRMKQTFGRSFDVTNDRAGKAVGETTPDYTSDQQREYRYRLLGSFDPEIPSIADGIESARARLESLPSESTARGMVKPPPESPKEIEVAPPKLKKPATPEPLPEYPEEKPAELKGEYKPAAEVEEPPAYPEEVTVEPPKTKAVEVPQISTRQLRKEMVDRWLSGESRMDKFQVRRLVDGGIGAIIGGSFGHAEGATTGAILGGAFGPALMAKFVDSAPIRNWLERPPARELATLQSIPYADRIRIADGLKQVVDKAKADGKPIPLAAAVSAFITANAGATARGRELSNSNQPEPKDDDTVQDPAEETIP